MFYPLIHYPLINLSSATGLAGFTAAAKILQENLDLQSNAFNNRLLQTWPHLCKGGLLRCGFIRLYLSYKKMGVIKNIHLIR